MKPKIFRYLIIICITTVISMVMINVFILRFSKIGYYNNGDDLTENYVGLVLGASILSPEKPSQILKDRLDAAFAAYDIGKIQKIIVSGDNSNKHYNEPAVMQKYLLGLGVSLDDIYLDYAGFDTYDSLYRAKEIFGVGQVTIFTQGFHLTRAMYIAKRLGLVTIGLDTSLHNYQQATWHYIREIFARIKAFLEVEIFKTQPKFLGERIQILTDEKIREVKNRLIH